MRKSLALLDKIQDERLRRELEINLQAALIGSINITQGPTSLELSSCCERGLQLSRETGRTKMVFPFIFGQFTFANCRGQIEEAKSLADLFLSLAKTKDMMPVAWSGIGFAACDFSVKAMLPPRKPHYRRRLTSIRRRGTQSVPISLGKTLGCTASRCWRWRCSCWVTSKARFASARTFC